MLLQDRRRPRVATRSRMMLHAAVASMASHRLGILATHMSPQAGNSCGFAASVAPAAAARRPRLAIGKLQQETNDLSPVPTTQQHFIDFGFHRGPATLVGAGREGSVEGFLTVVEAWESPPEVVGIASTAAWAAGRITADCWAWLLDEYVGSIERLHREDGGLDGIYLVLHGAMIVDGLDDPEGELLARVREIVGPDCPIVASCECGSRLLCLQSLSLSLSLSSPCSAARSQMTSTHTSRRRCASVRTPQYSSTLLRTWISWKQARARRTCWALCSAARYLRRS